MTMGFLYLLAAVIGSSSLVIILKVFELKKVDLYAGITVNYIAGALLAYLFASTRLSWTGVVESGWLPISIIIGAMFMISLVIYGISAQRSGVAITTISGRAAVVIPVVFAFAALGEQPTALKILMLVLILLAMVMILGGGKPKGNIVSGKWLIFLPLAVFLCNGISDTLVQYASREKLPADSTAIYPMFVCVMFLGGALTGLVFYIGKCIRTGTWYLPKGRDILWGSLLGFMNWMCMIGVFYALSFFEGSVFYPLYYTGAIVISTIVGVWVFKEKLSKLNWIGISVAIAAIAVLSTL